jgi:hypothetical protein
MGFVVAAGVQNYGPSTNFDRLLSAYTGTDEMSVWQSVSPRSRDTNWCIADEFLRSYSNLNSKAKLGVGAGLLIWGLVGLYLSDHAEKKFGFTPTEADKAGLEKMTPKLHVVDREQRGR